MKTKNLPLIIGIALPILFIIVISVVIFVPSLYVKPAHDFIYTTTDRYVYNQLPTYAYAVQSGKIALDPIQRSPSTNQNITYTTDMPTLYRYDTKNNTIHTITFEEAKAFMLDAGPSSPDGYIVGYEYNHDGIFELFGSGNDNRGYYISKGNAKKKLPGITSDIYSNNLKLIGWIK